MANNGKSDQWYPIYFPEVIFVLIVLSINIADEDDKWLKAGALLLPYTTATKQLTHRL